MNYFHNSEDNSTANESELVFENVKFEDEGIYRCQVFRDCTNDQLIASGSCKLVVDSDGKRKNIDLTYS